MYDLEDESICPECGETPRYCSCVVLAQAQAALNFQKNTEKNITIQEMDEMLFGGDSK
jgi:hypothetical protein